MSSPWLSVLMPTYNGAAYLGAALESIVAEDDPGVECIAVDDGSSDDTIAILERFRDRLNLEIVARPHAGNWVANTNLALARARGAFACLLHQDDIWLPGRLAALEDARTRHPSVDLFLHPTWFIDPAGRRLGQWRCPLPADPAVLDAETVLPRLLVQNFIAIPAPMFRTATAREVGGLDEALWYTADWDFWLKLAARAPAVYLPEPLAGFRVHAASQTNRRSFDIDGFRRQHEVVLERHLPFLARPPAENRRTRRLALFSVDANAALVARYHGLAVRWAPLAIAALRLGPNGLRDYLHTSRLRERILARLRARETMTLSADPSRDSARGGADCPADHSIS